MADAVSLRAADARRRTVYVPAGGFAAWVSAFDYGNGRLGLSFKEIIDAPCPNFRAPRLEMGEAVGAPVSYCSAECGSEKVTPQRVYMASDDGGETYYETGRCPLEEGSFLNAGFPDGRIVGLDVGRINETRTGWCDCIAVRESLDGGTTWRETARLLEGTAPYLWRLKRLRDGSLLVLASFYGAPWGPGRERPTRNSTLPGETYLRKIQTFFLHSRDGRTFTGPHYVLPGIGAHEYDAVELSGGELLFVAGDVQATPPGRQLVRPVEGGFVNGPLLPVELGAPPDPEGNPQGGVVPETIAVLPGDLLVGARRGKPYTVSADLGANWHVLPGVPGSLYQPCIQALPGGDLICFGHEGGDCALGQAAMSIGADRFRLEGTPPRRRQLTLERLMAEDGSHYRNAYAARLTCGGAPQSGQRVCFRFTPYWRPDGTADTAPQEQAPLQLEAVTDEEGVARVRVPAYDSVRDIHFSYRVDAVALEGLPCRSLAMEVTAMTPRRRCRWPYPAYFAEDALFCSPELEARFPDLYERMAPLVGTDGSAIGDRALEEALLEAGVLCREEGSTRWIGRVHGGPVLKAVLPQGDGDWYV